MIGVVFKTMELHIIPFKLSTLFWVAQGNELDKVFGTIKSCLKLQSHKIRLTSGRVESSGFKSFKPTLGVGPRRILSQLGANLTVWIAFKSQAWADSKLD